MGLYLIYTHLKTKLHLQLMSALLKHITTYICLTTTEVFNKYLFSELMSDFYTQQK